MSGIEIAGLVLGSFPILLNCLQYYREGFEPLNEYRFFGSYFCTFVNSVRHQMMVYHDNMVRLLLPIVMDYDRLNSLVQDTTDPRWTDGSLDHVLKERLGSEYDRFFMIMEGMDAVIQELKHFLRIRGSNIHWTESEQKWPWIEHLQRIRISFSKGKTRKVKRLNDYNEQLDAIIGHSERVFPLFSRMQTSSPILHFDKLRELSCATHRALSQTWICQDRDCSFHQASLCLRADADTIHVNIRFLIKDKQGLPLNPMIEEVTIREVTQHIEAHTPMVHINHVRQAESFARAQGHFRKTDRSGSSQITMRPISRALGRQDWSDHSEQMYSALAASAETEMTDTDIRRCSDLCSMLCQTSDHDIGIITDKRGRTFRLSTSSESISAGEMPPARGLVELSDVIKACQQARTELSRYQRFEMAVHLASGLLQIQQTPWLSHGWSGKDLQFVGDSKRIYSTRPYVSQSFDPGAEDQQIRTETATSPISREEDTRKLMLTLGMMILELIFGQSIRTCRYRYRYYGPNNQPNDQTDTCTARRWSKDVLADSGVEIHDVIRRCLDCSFGPRPDLDDQRFREAVYYDVVEPLAKNLDAWNNARSMVR